MGRESNQFLGECLFCDMEVKWPRNKICFRPELQATVTLAGESREDCS